MLGFLKYFNKWLKTIPLQFQNAIVIARMLVEELGITYSYMNESYTLDVHCTQESWFQSKFLEEMNLILKKKTFRRSNHSFIPAT